MNKPKNCRNINGDIVTINQAALRTNLSVYTIRRLASECGAALKIGRSYRINIQKLIDYLSTMSNVSVEKTPEPRSRNPVLMPKENTVTSLRVSKKLLEDLHTWSEAENVTLTDFTNYILTKGFASYFEEKERETR